MNVETLRGLFEYELRGLYDIENELVGTLDDFANQAGIDSLDDEPNEGFRKSVQQAFIEHRDETETHVERLERVFEALGMEAKPREALVFDALVEEKERFNNVVLNDALRNPFYLTAGIKVEQLEIATYESALDYADNLDVPDEVTELLQKNLDEETETLETLRTAAEGSEFESMLNRLGEHQ